MARVRIDSGPITPDLFLRDVAKEKWTELIKKRKIYLEDQLYSDCRYLVRFVQEAAEMWKELGYDSTEDLVRRGYGLEPEEVSLAVRWLQLNDPDTPISLNEVVGRSTTERVQFAAQSTTGEVLPRGGDQRSEEPMPKLGVDRTSRAKGKGVGKETQRKLDTLARVAPEQLKRVKAGEVSAHRACIDAGIIKEPTTLDKLRKLWKEATPKERKTFLQEIKDG